MDGQDNKPTIWILNHYAGAMYESCSGRHHWFAKKLQERGYRVVVFCADTRYGRSGRYVDMGTKRFMEAVTDDGVRYVFVKCADYEGNGINRVRNMTSFQSGVKKAMSALAKLDGKPDLILASSVHPLTLVAGEVMARKWHIPCICEVRDLWPEAFFYGGALKEGGLIGKTLTEGERWIYERADALIFLKPGDPSYISEHGWDSESGGAIDLSRVFYINNGIDLAAFDERAESEAFEDADLDSGKHLFVYAGTINKTNAVGNLVDVAAMLSDRDDIKILVYGSGVELESLKERVKREGYSNIVFKGFVDRRRIPYILRKATASILNYSATGYNWARGNSSNKLFEYLAAGKPVISTVKMGHSPIEEERCGLSLDVADAEHLARAITDLCDMDEKDYQTMSSSARTVAEQYDFEVMTDKLETVIATVLEGKPAHA